MTEKTTDDVISLAQEAMIRSLPVPDTKPVPCKSDDKECVARWVQAFSDCD